MTPSTPTTTAPLTVEQIQSIRLSHEKCGNDCNILNMADMVLASLTRPVPSDMAQNLTRPENVLTDREKLNMAQPTEGKPSDAAKQLVNEIIRLSINSFSGSSPNVIAQQAIDAARAEGLEAAVNICMSEMKNAGNRPQDDIDEINYWEGRYEGAEACLTAIRALIPAAQQTEGEV